MTPPSPTTDGARGGRSARRLPRRRPRVPERFLMSAAGWLQLVLLVVGARDDGPFGRYMARVLEPGSDRGAPGDRIALPLERFIYRIAGIDDRK